MIMKKEMEGSIMKVLVTLYDPILKTYDGEF